MSVASEVAMKGIERLKTTPSRQGGNALNF